MKPATEPRSPQELRILVVDACSGEQHTSPASALADLLRPGDLVVVNDAATLPASFHARTASGAAVELRLVGAIDPDGGAVRFKAALLGSGDYRTPTEDRPAPPRVGVGDLFAIGDDLTARVLAVAPFSDRLVDLEFTSSSSASGTIWAAMYRAGKPVQYTHVPRPLALWDVQNVFAGRPWAVEMPSAGRALRAGTLSALRRRGIEIASVTHAAGLSATGDPSIDSRLPLPERFEVPESTARAVLRTKARGGRVLAIGTSVVRALESAARASRSGLIAAASGTTDLILRPGAKRAVVDGLLTGVHESDTTHFTLLGAFAGRDVLDAALHSAEREHLLGHEFGDAWLVWGERGCAAWRRATSATVAA